MQKFPKLTDGSLLQKKQSPAYWIATLVGIAGGGLLIYFWSTARPMWVDEEMLALNVRDRIFARLSGPLWLDQSAPLGWLALERLVLLTFGTGERAVRLVTLLFGIGTLSTGVWIGRRWMTPGGAAVLVSLCAIGPWIVFFTLELKHYSADTFWALLVPALAGWAIETETDPSALIRRIKVWWMVAAIGLWLGNGALFVTPACAVVLSIACWRRAGPRAVVSTFFPAFGWLVSFGLHYTLALRHALGNTYLQHYWAYTFPPVSAGVEDTMQWLVARFAAFATKPAGSGLPALFWIASAAGIVFAIATRHPLGFVMATVPLSAVALAVFRLVPMWERLTLWAVPALYVCIGICVDASFWLGRRSVSRRGGIAIVLALAAGVVATVVCVDILRRGEAEINARPRSNYGLDDRSSIRWLMETRRAGDVLMTTHFGLAAIWWYGNLNISEAVGDGGRLQDGTPIFEVGHEPAGPGCDLWNEEMTAVLSGHSRVMVYLGFRLNVEPPGFDSLVLQTLGQRGVLVGYRPYAEESRVAIFDLTQSPLAKPVIPVEPGAHRDARLPAPPGCVAVRAAHRW